MIFELVLLSSVLLAAGDEAPADAEPRMPAATVPSVKGQPVAMARQVLHLARLQTASGIFFIAPKNWRDDIAPGRVLVQTPQPGMIVPLGSTVACWTFAKAADDQPLVDMPDLRGLALSAAHAKLAELGLEPMPQKAAGKKKENEQTANEQTVADHYPRSGQRVYRGTSVFLLLSDSAGN